MIGAANLFALIFFVCIISKINKIGMADVSAPTQSTDPFDNVNRGV